MSDDDIQIIEKTTDASLAGNNDICQLCSTNLNGLSADEREHHYDGHRNGDSVQPIRPCSKRGRPKPAPASSSPRKPEPVMVERGTKRAKQQDIFWYAAQAAPPPENYTPEVLSILKEALKRSYRNGATRRAVLCYEQTPHIYHETFDLKWGCGYRNFLMACSALMSQQIQTLYFPNLDAPLPPSVGNLQHWIQDAWEHGYDDVGANELGRELVGTKTKIGTAELYVAFTSRKIPCELVDFDIRKARKGFETLVDWVVKYFDERLEGDVNQILRATTPVVATNKMPVILQYEGHSVTIVGYELGKNDKYNLLVFDPSSKVLKAIHRAAGNGVASVSWGPTSRLSLGKTKRRGQSNSPIPKKRSRTNQDSDDDISDVPSLDDDEMDYVPRAGVAKLTKLDPDEIIKAFKFKTLVAKKKSEYQLLYFTMRDPLSDQEQCERKVVFSAPEC